MAQPSSSQVKYQDIVQGPGADWLTYHGDYEGKRYSPLKQITRDNVATLVPKWTYHVEGARRLEATPIVSNGVMYITNSNEVDALDARTGQRIWQFRDDQATQQGVNRGVAVLGDRVYFLTADVHLVALERNTGALVWEKQYATNKVYNSTLAPLALKDRLIVGVGGGESGMRGFVAALSASTGEELWRFYTIPAKNEPGGDSWGGFPAQYGGGATWMTGTYDPELNLIYWAVGNPWPDMYGLERRGDDLYTCSVVALDADTGKLKWYFQFTPHDTHDWDAQSIPVLVDIDYQGQRRKLMLHPNRNGFFYVLDRTNGQFLRATPFVKNLTWATGIDAKGRPIEVPGTEPTVAGVKVCPSSRGASNWMSPTFDPETGLLYVPTVEACSVYTRTETEPAPERGLWGGGAEDLPGGQIFLRALDPKTGEKRWEYPMTGPTTMWAGAISTAGGVVIFGDDDGQHLWHYSLGQTLTASPITYSVDGKQYVCIASATDVFSFGLFEPAAPVPLVSSRQ
jgi:alcohol dehydrogenase (cytochrome c)